MPLIKRYGRLKEDMALTDVVTLLNNELDQIIGLFNKLPAEANPKTKLVDIKIPPNTYAASDHNHVGSYMCFRGEVAATADVAAPQEQDFCKVTGVGTYIYTAGAWKDL